MALPRVVDGYSRRRRVDQRVPAEHSIGDAVLAVEALGADPRLTKAIVLLADAAELVADTLEDPAFKPADEDLTLPVDRSRR